MIKPGALVMAVVMAAMTTGTYYGLDHVPVPPPFGRTPATPPPPPGGKSTAIEPTAVVPAGNGEVQVAAAADEPADEAAAAEPSAPADAPLTEADIAEAPPSEALAAEAPPPEPAPAKVAPATPPAAKKAPAPAKKAPAPTASASAKPVDPVQPNPPAADVIKPWWPDPAKMPAEQLKLQYAGQVQGEQAIALLFSAPLNLQTVERHAQILTHTGEPVQGQWELGKNPRLAVFRGVKLGRYTIVLPPQIADTKGFMLGTTLKGPVYIQP